MSSANPRVRHSLLAAATRALRARLRRGLLFMLVLCTAIALFLSLLWGDPRSKFVYSFAIGLCCWLITDGARLSVAWVVDRLRAQRGVETPAGTGFELGWAGMIPLMLLSLTLGPALGLTIGDWLVGGDSPSLLNVGSTPTQVTLAITLLGTLVAMVVLSSFEHLAQARARAEAAQREAAELQLRLLQSQLEPHMLFNTLANLRVLIGLDPARAQAMLDRLIAFLRATLSASRVERHALATEFERVADYLALMALRMGPRLQSSLTLPEALRATPVPPLLLQPLVENSIRHGLEPKPAGGRIEVRAERVGSRLRLTVQDSGLGLGSAGSGGSSGTRFGLQQVRQRLQALFADRASLTLANVDAPGGGARAIIELPLDEPASP